jgi:hypothetical protein
MDARNFMEKHYPEAVKLFDQIGSEIDSDVTSAVVDLLNHFTQHKLTEQGGKYYREVDQSKSKLLIVDRNDMLSAITGVEPCPPPQTLDREKVMEIFDNMRSGLSLRSREEVIKWREEITDAICSLPSEQPKQGLNDEEIVNIWVKNSEPYNEGINRYMLFDQFKTAIKELNKKEK